MNVITVELWWSGALLEWQTYKFVLACFFLRQETYSTLPLFASADVSIVIVQHPIQGYWQIFVCYIAKTRNLLLFQIHGPWNCPAICFGGFEKTFWLQDVHVWNSCFG